MRRLLRAPEAPEFGEDVLQHGLHPPEAETRGYFGTPGNSGRTAGSPRGRAERFGSVGLFICGRMAYVARPRIAIAADEGVHGKDHLYRARRHRA